MNLCKSIKTLAAATVFGLGASATQAGIINWSGPFDTLTGSDVFNNGSLVEAFNMGEAASDVEVNGVSFVATDGILSNSTSANFLNAESSGDPDYDDLLRTLDFGNGTSFNVSIGGGNLKVGTDYLVQAWFTDLRAGFASRTMVLGDGNANTVDVNASAGGLGQYAIGRFVADSGSQTLSLASPGFGNVHLNAFQVREVPVPAPLALLGIGILALSLRQK